ncbi:helix-turn-helix transcriptional regulator [Marinobacterium arenosum]|uniref:helix-turn-helix transcriptional regulator n=1 Tax=Marinobacterium arenosum TaxID=2862496 RepID=UPI001C942687|nr:helix-turn-helix domain-containing protein [Marinobacterium arenosum]MBY4678771.1 AraC family transcriptional regulator [Marinobacterium arenosum]
MQQTERARLLARLRTLILATDSQGPYLRFHCVQPQRLHAVPIHQPALILVLQGEKRLYSPADSATEGQLLLLPAGSSLQFENLPQRGAYLALVLGFSQQAVALYRQLQPSLTTNSPPRFLADSTNDLLEALCQFLQRLPSKADDSRWCLLRQVELLSALADADQVQALLSSGSERWRDRVLAQLQLDPARPWKIEQLCQALATSETSLRRNLRDEGTGFRELLDEVRLGQGLMLLQASRLPVGEIAERCGYQSASRFSERFRNRFGMTPAKLRATLPDQQGAAERGEMMESAELTELAE